MRKQLALAALICAVLLWWGCGDFNGDGNGFVPPPMPTVQSLDSEPDWSLDGETIVYTHAAWDSTEIQYGEFQIWLLDLQTMEMCYLTEGMMPAWSPNGETIAFVRNNDIHVVDVETVGVTRLTHWGECFHPSWSPDGTRIAFETAFGDYAGIWIMNADGSGKKQITWFYGDCPDWSPDGLRLALIWGLADDAPYGEIALLGLADSSVVRLTENDRSDRDPAWSHDGGRIAWGSYGMDGDPCSGIWVMNADGSDQHQIMEWGGYPSWSPDGSMIVHTAYNEDSNTSTLWLMNADGTDPHPLTTPEDYE